MFSFVFYNTGLLAMDFFTYLVTSSVLDIKFLVSSFNFSNLNISSLCVLAFTVPDETLPVNHIGLSLYNFFFYRFHDFLLIFSFQHLTIVCLGVSSVWTYLVFVEVFWCVDCFSSNLDISVWFFSPIPFLSSGTPIMNMLVYLIMSHISLRLFFFIIFFSLSNRGRESPHPSPLLFLKCQK